MKVDLFPLSKIYEHFILY